MQKMKRSILVWVIVSVFMSAGVVFPGLVCAGELEPPDLPGPTMKTLDEIAPTWS